MPAGAFIRRSCSVLASAPVVLFVAVQLAIAGQAGSSAAARPSASLLPGFESPPRSAAPRVWWHWLNGNIAEAGIRKDLAWMHRVGIGGVDVIDAVQTMPQVVKVPVTYMSPGWKDAFRYAAHLATGYGMEFGIDSSPGWSETGGPWVKPCEAMKKLVWSATLVAGGKPFHGVLPQPPLTTGPIQNAPMSPGPLGPPRFARLKFYRDSVVIAYKAPTLDPRPVSATSSTGPLDARSLAELADGSLRDGMIVPQQGGKAWLQLQYGRSVRIQGLTLAASALPADRVAADVYASVDGESWKSIARLVCRFPQATASFAPIAVRYVRVQLAAIPPRKLSTLMTDNAPGAVPPSTIIRALIRARIGTPKLRNTPSEFHIQELVMHSRATINELEAKAYFRIVPNYDAIASHTPAAAGTVVNPQEVLNLTGRMQPDGRLDWNPPPGRWVVLRMGYSLEGTANHPAPAVATGLEVDKLSRRDVEAYLAHYLQMYQAVVGPFGRNSVTALTNDSTEVGAQNWTDGFLQDFRRLRGYDPLPWLPALTGVVVSTPAQSDRFLWDFRRTIDELVARNHYEVIARLAHARGLVTYAESLEGHRSSFGDDMEMRRYADVPMGAMWMYGHRGPDPAYLADLRGAASIAHVYGRQLVGAESFDSMDQPWAYAPRELKPVVDLEFTLGVNRVFIHEAAHQPIDDPPGLSLWIFGQMFDRLETWAPDARPWVRYMARCSYLLQQGHYAADIAYFYGQEAPVAGLFSDRPIDVPQGYGFDFVDSGALKSMLSVDHGELVTRSGMRYRILFLGGSTRMMTLDVLRRIDQLVRDGATVVGRRPVASPSLRDDPAQFPVIAGALFGPPGSTTERHVGAGTVFPSGSLAQALETLRLRPDFEYSKPQADTELRYIHRHLDEGEIYFISNRLDRTESLTGTFRVVGRTPELWNPVTGQVEPTRFRITDGHTSIPLRLPPYGSLFVVFDKATRAKSVSAPKASRRTFLTLEGPWSISFGTSHGAPVRMETSRLESWSDSTIPGVRYFSGTGTYKKMFRLPDVPAGAHLSLDLGQVWELAKVSVNGQPVGIVWTPPFRLDITKYVHPGENSLSIAVTNLWVNRLIGDQQPGVDRKHTFTTIPTYEPEAPLRESGLLGPVHIEQVTPPGGGGA